MSTQTWQSDWPFRIYSRLEAFGFHSLSEFLDSRPVDTLIAIADELGTDIAAVQLEALWYREASSLTCSGASDTGSGATEAARR